MKIPVKSSPFFLGQSLTPEQQSAYYRKLGDLLAEASEIAAFVLENPDLSRRYGLDLDASLIAEMVGGLEKVQWDVTGRLLQEGAGTQMHANKIDELATLVEPAARRLQEARSEIPASKVSFPFPLLIAIGAVGLAATEIFGLTNIFGLRERP